MDIQAKIDLLQRVYEDGDAPQDREELTSLERSYTRVRLIADLADHDGLKILIGQYRKEVESLKDQIVSDPENLSSKGQLLYGKMKMYEEWVGDFDDAEVALKNIENHLDENIDHALEQGWLKAE